MSRRVLGIDFGTVRIGLALSDQEAKIAMPFKVVDAKGAVPEILRIIEEEYVGTIVVGLPLNMDGSEGQSAVAARAFAESLDRSGIPVYMFDERLTTVSAQRSMREGSAKERESRSKVDKVAAAILLQAYLDSEGGA